MCGHSLVGGISNGSLPQSFHAVAVRNSCQVGTIPASSALVAGKDLRTLDGRALFG